MFSLLLHHELSLILFHLQEDEMLRLHVAHVISGIRIVRAALRLSL